MYQNSRHAGNVILVRAAALWLLLALALAWCLVGLKLNIPLFQMIFPGKFSRLLQAHLDLLLMSALLFGFYAAKFALPWHVNWAMVIGAFTNSMMFMLMAVFPFLDSPTPEEGVATICFRLYTMISLIITSYGFGKGAITVYRATFIVSKFDE